MNQRILFVLVGAIAMVIAALSQFNTAHAAGKSGTFSSHKSYKVRGKASVMKSGNKTVVSLSGFSTSSGPDLYVYVGNGSPSKRIAKLKANSGSQTYTLPKGIDASSISSVHIHCKRFNSTFGSARLR